MHHHVQEVSVWVWILKWKYYRVDLEDSRKGWILLFFWHFSFYLFAPATYIIHTSLLSKRRSDKQSPHAKLLFKSGFFNFRNGLCLFVKWKYHGRSVHFVA